jgi:hypothetical protein
LSVIGASQAGTCAPVPVANLRNILWLAARSTYKQRLLQRNQRAQQHTKQSAAVFYKVSKKLYCILSAFWKYF